MQRKGESSLLNSKVWIFFFFTFTKTRSEIIWHDFFYRSDHKDMMEEVGDNQQSGYSQCMFPFIQRHACNSEFSISSVN